MIVLIKSMTGYGISQVLDVIGNISIEIKSVNSRYLELSVKTPKGYSFLEDNIKSIIKKRVHRGKFDVFLNIEGVTSCEEISINHDIAQMYLKALNDLKEKYGLIDDISVSLLSKYPEVLTITKKHQDEDLIIEKISDVLSVTIDKLIMMREQEGQKLKLDISSRLDLIFSIIENIENEMPKIIEEYKKKLIKNINDFVNEEKFCVDENRILTEIAIFADKIAIDEETVRIKSHISQFKLLLESNNEVGRKMDFLVQELNREINTIGSKVHDIDVSNMIIEVKAQLEKIREQVQNIE